MSDQRGFTQLSSLLNSEITFLKAQTASLNSAMANATNNEDSSAIRAQIFSIWHKCKTQEAELEQELKFSTATAK
jgi:hypothetical protein